MYPVECYFSLSHGPVFYGRDAVRLGPSSKIGTPTCRMPHVTMVSSTQQLDDSLRRVYAEDSHKNSGKYSHPGPT